MTDKPKRYQLRRKRKERRRLKALEEEKGTESEGEDEE